MTLTVRDFTAGDQAEVRELVLQGLGDHWGTIEAWRNPDLDDIAASYAGGRTVVVEHDGVIVHPDRPYEVGQQVRMAGGAFDGLVATVIGMREKDRLTVLLQLLSRTVRVELGTQDLSPV